MTSLPMAKGRAVITADSFLALLGIPAAKQSVARRIRNDSTALVYVRHGLGRPRRPGACRTSVPRRRWAASSRRLDERCFGPLNRLPSMVIRSAV
jgi:hypothetical protein